MKTVRVVSILVALALCLTFVGASVAADTGALVNINTADEAVLTTLQHIGQAKARAIVEYRGAHGVFKTIDDLKAVPGIGEKIFEAIKDRITVGMAEKRQG